MVNQTISLGGPATYASAKVLTVPESGDLVPQPLALYLKAASTFTITTIDGDSIVFASMPAGTLIPFRIKTITAIGTAGAVLGLY